MKVKTKKAKSEYNNLAIELVERLNKKFGDGSVYVASQAKGLAIRMFSTGAFRLDFALGGGIPEGRQTEIFGPESAGKTTLLLTAMASFQRKYSNGICVLVDFEKTYDPDYATRLGLDQDRTLIILPDFGEQGVDMIKEVLSQPVHIFIGVDSIAAIVASSTMEHSADKAEIGVQARIINRMVAVCNARSKRSLTDPDYPTTTIVFLNQIREKVGVMFGSPETTPGGRGKNFFASLRLRLFSSNSKANKIVATKSVDGIEKQILVGKVISFEVVKTKTGSSPNEIGEYKYYVRKNGIYPAWTYDNLDGLFEYGVFHKLIEVTSDGYCFGEIVAKKKFGFLAKLSEDKVSQEDLYAGIIEKIERSNRGEEDADAEVIEITNNEETG